LIQLLKLAGPLLLGDGRERNQENKDADKSSHNGKILEGKSKERQCTKPAYFFTRSVYAFESQIRFRLPFLA
jgi:hypothetical protein